MSKPKEIAIILKDSDYLWKQKIGSPFACDCLVQLNLGETDKIILWLALCRNEDKKDGVVRKLLHFMLYDSPSRRPTLHPMLGNKEHLMRCGGGSLVDSSDELLSNDHGVY